MFAVAGGILLSIIAILTIELWLPLVIQLTLIIIGLIAFVLGLVILWLLISLISEYPKFFITLAIIIGGIYAFTFIYDWLYDQWNKPQTKLKQGGKNFAWEGGKNFAWERRNGLVIIEEERKRIKRLSTKSLLDTFDKFTPALDEFKLLYKDKKSVDMKVYNSKAILGLRRSPPLNTKIMIISANDFGYSIKVFSHLIGFHEDIIDCGEDIIKYDENTEEYVTWGEGFQKELEFQFIDGLIDYIYKETHAFLNRQGPPPNYKNKE